MPREEGRNAAFWPSCLVYHHNRIAPPGERTIRPRLKELVTEMLERGITLGEAVDAVERQCIACAIEMSNGCKKDAAEILGLHRNTLAAKMKKNGSATIARRRKKRVGQSRSGRR